MSKLIASLTHPTFCYILPIRAKHSGNYVNGENRELTARIRAKHSGNYVNGENRELTARMLRPYKSIPLCPFVSLW